MMDPIFLCELALALGMSVSEIVHGRGTPMSAHELAVVWPAYYAYRERKRVREEREDAARGR
jgi:hypothetical protein